MTCHLNTDNLSAIIQGNNNSPYGWLYVIGGWINSNSESLSHQGGKYSVYGPDSQPLSPR